jgi:predicted nucleic acid-binding protein
MRVTRKQLKQLIKEELSRLNEQEESESRIPSASPYTNKFYQEVLQLERQYNRPATAMHQEYYNRATDLFNSAARVLMYPHEERFLTDALDVAEQNIRELRSMLK